MKILIVNQPTKNRGDEAAHRGLVRALAEAYPQHRIETLWLGEEPEGCEPMQVEARNVGYENLRMRWGRTKWPRLALEKGWGTGAARALAGLHPAYRAYRARVRSADLAVSAPSGIMLGAFRTWRCLYNDLLVKAEGKPFAYYSPSFGPKPEGRPGDARFWRLAEEVLRGFDFLSIRDKRTMALADEMGLDYEPSVDTAFLDAPPGAVPGGLSEALAGRRRVVFVPNSLTWHVEWRGADAERIDRFWLAAAARVQGAFPGAKLVLLPQLFGRRDGGDRAYFTRLAAEAGAAGKDWVVAGEDLSSDAQQAVVAGADAVVGARYHSVVFAINNGTPFVALDYEHKMDGLLEGLGLEGRGVDIRGLGKDGFCEAAALDAIGCLCTAPERPLAARAAAKAAAKATFGAFRRRFAPLLEGGAA